MRRGVIMLRLRAIDARSSRAQLSFMVANVNSHEGLRLILRLLLRIRSLLIQIL